MSLAASLSGCVVEPYWYQLYDDHQEPIRITGYTASAFRPVDVYCGPQGTPTVYSYVTTITSTDEELSSGSETLYLFEDDVLFPESCWETSRVPTHEFQTMIKVLDQATGEPHEFFSSASFNCVATEYLTGSGPITAAETCHDAGWPKMLAAWIRASQ